MSDDLASRIEDAWLEAGDRLGIDVEGSYLLDTAMGSALYPVYRPDFGGQDGMVLMAAGHGEGDLPRLVARDAGLQYAELHSSHARYDAEEFRAALQEWGWYGPEDTAPGWLR
jgi:hypothetical protein